MQNTGNFNHFYIARFEASPKHIILKCRLIKTSLHKQLKFAKCLKYEKLKRKHLILVYCINIFMYFKQNLIL